jgi:tetratricopeptide (TPR) repeat protein
MGRPDDDLALGPTVVDGDAAPTDAAARNPQTDLGSLADELRGLAATPAPRRSGLEAGALVDEIYRIEDQLGEGGMGVVYRARDLRLDREVAIKIGTAVTPAALARAEREAMALAKLSHPNVVIVYGVGEIGGRIYLAMELVRGGSARAWSKAARRTPREIIELYAAAGDGLAAAHAAGLVHRDFKPDNVLVGDDGRPRVGDFGLARGVDTRDEAADEASAPAESNAITQTGAVLGTLGYMAPEQLGGQELDGRADQFAFCASVWEALYSARPFRGRTPRDVADAMERGVPRPPDGVKVPAHVLAALCRGLALDRDARWPSMAALCAELRRDPGARRRRAAVIAGVATAGAIAAGAVAVAWPRGGDTPAVTACDDGDAQIAQAWSPARADAIRAHAGISARRAVAALDDHARRWSVQYRAVCGAAVRGWTPAQIAQGRECLTARRDQLAGAAALVGDASLDAGRIEGLITALDAPERCADVAYLAADAPPPDDPARAVTAIALERTVAHANQLDLVGRHADAAVIDGAAVAGARVLGYAPLYAKALSVRGTIETPDDPKAALADQRDAYFRAQEAHARATAAVAAADATVALLNLSRYDEAGDWARLAADAAREVRDPVVRAKALVVGAMVASDTGHNERAVELASQALAVATATGNPDLIQRMLYTRGSALIAMGRPGEGVDDLRRGIAVVTRGLGADSPELVDLDVQLGTALAAMGRPGEAEPILRAAVALAARDYGPDNARTGDAMDQLGGALDGLERYDEALAMIDRGLAITERVQGPRAFNTGVSYANRAMVLNDLGRVDESEAADRRAIEIFTDALGPDDEMVAQEWTNLGLTYDRANRRDDAIAALEKAKAIYEKAAPDHPTLAFTLTALGNLRGERGQLAAARADLERAFVLRSAPDADPGLRAITEIELANVAWRQGDRTRATELARAAVDHFSHSVHAPSSNLASYFDEILGKGKWRRTER